VTSPPAFHEPFKLTCVALDPCPTSVASTPARVSHVVTTPHSCVTALASKLASSDWPTAAPTTDHASEVATAASDDNGLTRPLDVGTLTGESYVFWFLQKKSRQTLEVKAQGKQIEYCK